MKLVSPVKDLFGAIFFVSVGMMVDPAMIVAYALPIFFITLAIIVGQFLFATSGVLLAGQPLKLAMQCSFSLMQIGEFAFIIASLGVSLGVTSDFLYPIVVAVSVITTFLTPYMIRAAIPVYHWIDRMLPARWKKILNRYVGRSQTVVNQESNWRKLVHAVIRVVAVYGVLSLAVVLLTIKFVLPLFHAALPDFWARLLGCVFALLALSPFLRAIVMKKNHSIEFQALWQDSRFNRAPLLSIILFRIIIAIGFIVFVIEEMYQVSTAFVVGMAVILLTLMMLSRRLKKQSIFLERTFIQNLRFREAHAQFTGRQRPGYAGSLLSKDLHLSDFIIPADSLWAGLTLRELSLGHRFGVHVASIIRGNHRLNIPGADTRLFPGDTIQVIGTDDQLSEFARCVEKVSLAAAEDDITRREMFLKQFVIDSESKFLGKTIIESGIRNKFKCLVVGVERGNGTVFAPNVHIPFEEGDVVWVVGEQENVHQLLEG